MRSRVSSRNHVLLPNGGFVHRCCVRRLLNFVVISRQYYISKLQSSSPVLFGSLRSRTTSDRRCVGKNVLSSKAQLHIIGLNFSVCYIGVNLQQIWLLGPTNQGHPVDHLCEISVREALIASNSELLEMKSKVFYKKVSPKTFLK